MTNWLWWCLNYISSSCKTLPWHGDVISSGPAETPLPYFLLPCTLNRSALRNGPGRLCSRACIIWPRNSLFPTTRHYLPHTSVNPGKELAICQCRSPPKPAAINWKTMTGPSGRVKAICVVASPGHLLISSLRRCLLLTCNCRDALCLFSLASSLLLAAGIYREDRSWILVRPRHWNRANQCWGQLPGAD